MQQPYDILQLVLREDKNGRRSSVFAWRATCDFYGWSRNFDEWAPKTIGFDGGYELAYFEEGPIRGRTNGGYGLRICRSPNKGGHPRGLTNRFKVSNSCGMFELAKLAYFTDVNWYWMEAPDGSRLTRQRWRDIYVAGLARSA